MAYNISINGVDRTGDVLSKSLQISDEINDKVNTCDFSLIDRSGNGIPDTDQEIIITLADDTIIFGGYIISVSMSKIEFGEVTAQIRCVDYGRLLNRNLAHISYEDATDKEIIEDLIATYAAGFGITTTDVLEGATIDQIVFNYVQLSQAFRKLADLTGRNWYIDYDKSLHYFPLTQNPAPFDISDEGEFVIAEDFATLPSGVLTDNATYVSTYIRLTQAVNSQKGAITYTQTTPDRFSLQTQFYSGGGGGADSVFIFWGSSSAPVSEEDAKGGYLVAYDEYTDEIQLWFNTTMLTSIAQSGIDNATFRDAEVIVNRTATQTNIKIYLDNTLKIEYVDTVRSLAGSKMGLGSRTGGVNNEHRVRGFYLQDLDAVSEAIQYKGLRIKKDASQIKNRIYVRGGTKLSDFTTYAVKGDGAARQFPLPDKPHEVTIEVNGVSKSVGIKNVNTSGYDWYLNFQEKYVEQDAGGTLLTTSDTLEVTYKYDIPILVAQEDATSIAAHGVQEFAIFDKQITTTDAARDRAIAELTDYANSIVDASFTTWTPGFRSGQFMNIAHAAYGISDDYMIQKVQARSIGGGVFEYSVSLASSKTMGIIRFLIELLENNRNIIELDPNEVVDELFTISDALLSDSLTDMIVDSVHTPPFKWSNDAGTTTNKMRWDLFQWG